MKLMSRVLVSAVGLLAPFIALAESPAVLAKLEARYSDVQSMRASFAQTSYSEIFGDETVKGILTVKRPKFMRWVFEDKKLFLSDGTKMWIYTPVEKQVFKYDNLGDSSSTADSLLQSLDKLEELFSVAEAPAEEGTHHLVLTPKEGDKPQFKKVDLVLDSALLVKTVDVLDTADSRTTLVFSDVELNIEVADAEFSFTVPEGVEVISASMN